MSPTGNPHWKVKLSLSWTRVDDRDYTCDWCGGSGQTGGGRFDNDDATPCNQCHGHGTVKRTIPGPPPLPKDLWDELSAVYNAWYDRQSFVQGLTDQGTADKMTS